MNEKTKDVLTRAGKTFIQALLATAITQIIAALGAGATATLDPRALLVTVGLPALAAGLSAVQNLLFPTIKPPDESSGEEG